VFNKATYFDLLRLHQANSCNVRYKRETRTFVFISYVLDYMCWPDDDPKCRNMTLCQTPKNLRLSMFSYVTISLIKTTGYPDFKLFLIVHYDIIYSCFATKYLHMYNHPRWYKVWIPCIDIFIRCTIKPLQTEFIYESGCREMAELSIWLMMSHPSMEYRKILV